MLVALPTIPFDRLKAHLVTDHLLNNVQRVEKFCGDISDESAEAFRTVG
jgi:hypothetical protein